MRFTHFIKPFIPRILRPSLRFYKLRLTALKSRLDDFLSKTDSGGIPLPPPLLRYRVHGALDRQSFLVHGLKCASDLRGALSLVNRELYSFDNVLDFGCGGARILRWFHDHPQSCRLYGTDVDAEAIAWCRRAIGFAQFAVNDPLPPLPFPSRTFDLIYAASVFTHLDEDFQFAWLEELQRVTKPKATLILTTHGSYALEEARQMLATHGGYVQSELSSEDLLTLCQKGFLFKVLETGRLKLDGLPDYYQCTYHTKQYVTSTWSRFFRIRHYVERGLDDRQDLVVLEKE